MEFNGIRVVIADDEPITRMDIKEILESFGYHVVQEASDGFDAVEACKKYHPDLVLLDTKMPILDGISAARIINEELLADTIVFLTAYSEKGFVEQAKAVGAYGYLVKPVEEKALIPSIELAMARSEEMRRLRTDIQKVSDRLENRVLIEKAKGKIMCESNMTEQQAYEYIKKLSLEKSVSMKRVAEIIMVQRDDG